MRKISFFLFCVAFGTLLPLLPPASTTFAQQAHSPVSPQSFTLQIMTILDKFTADNELQKVRKHGYSAYISKYTTESGKVIYKLRSGKYANRSSAVAAAKEYQAKEGVAVMVVTASDDAPAGKAQPAQKEVRDDLAAVEQTENGKNVRIKVQDSKKKSSQTSLQEKVAALERGHMPVQDQKTAQQVPDDGIWFTLQTNTESDKQAAERRINQLGRKGYDAYCVETPLQNGKTQFKIRVGKYASPEDAGRAAQKFNAQERRGCMVVKISPESYAETEQPVLAGRTALRGQQQDEPSEIETDTLLKATKTLSQKAGAQEAMERMPSADMPSEPEPAPPAFKDTERASEPEATEQPERTDNNSEQLETADAPNASAPPERMTKIYAYRAESGAVNLTNRYEDIPEAVRQNIEYISLFPVHIKDLSKNGPRLTIETDGQQTEMILAGFSMPKKNDSVRAYLETLKAKPLRLKYSPGKTTKDGAIAGRLFLKEGSYINLDMVRKGLGECSVQTLASDQQEAFRQAQDAAKRERLGIWAN
jgi:cell division septation protein DedD